MHRRFRSILAASLIAAAFLLGAVASQAVDRSKPTRTFTYVNDDGRTGDTRGPVAANPEPGAALLFAAGLGGTLFYLRRRNR